MKFRLLYPAVIEPEMIKSLKFNLEKVKFYEKKVVKALKIMYPSGQLVSFKPSNRKGYPIQYSPNGQVRIEVQDGRYEWRWMPWEKINRVIPGEIIQTKSKKGEG